MDANDLLIEAEAERRITRSLIPDLGSVMCNFRRGIMTLNGMVSNLQDRNVAQDLIEKIEGIEIIDNQLVVVTKETSLASGENALSDEAGWPGSGEPALLDSR
jgi:hypothetical protein